MAKRENRNISAVCQHTNEAGFILWEALLAIPMLVILLLSMTSIFMFCMRAYFYQLADGELVQEVQSAFSLVVEDLLAGQYIEEGTGSDKGFFIVGRRNPLANDSKPGEPKKESYWLHNMAGLVKLTRGRIYAPLTGDHTLAQVTVVEFSLERDEVYPDVYKLRLTGKSEMTKHEYTLCTAVYLPR